MGVRERLASVKLSRGRILGLAAGAVLIGVGIWWFALREDPDGPLVLYGNVDIREVELAFRREGRLTKLAFDEGDAVSKGDVVAELDTEPFQEALDAAEADVKAAQAELARLRSGNRPQEIAEAGQQVREASAAFEEAAANAQRQSALAKSGAVSARTAEAAEADRVAAAATLEAARQRLSLQRAGSRKEDVSAAEARLAAAVAARAQAQTALDDARLLAPADGIVLSRVREQGSMLSAGASVYTLSLRDPVYVRAYVSEEELGRVAPGARVEVRTDSSDKVYRGQVGFISPRAEFTPRSVETSDLRTDLVYRLRVVVGDADAGLRQGMPVTVDVLAAQRAGQQAAQQAGP